MADLNAKFGGWCESHPTIADSDKILLQKAIKYSSPLQHEIGVLMVIFNAIVTELSKSTKIFEYIYTPIFTPLNFLHIHTFKLFTHAETT